MKLPKNTGERIKKYELRIILPRVDIRRSKPLANSAVKRKKEKLRLSNHSDKENEMLNLRSYVLPKLNLVKIDEALSNIRQQKSKIAVKRDAAPATFRVVDNITVEKFEIERDGITSLSESVQVSHSTSSDEGTSHNTDNTEVQTVTSKKPNGYVTRNSKYRVLKDLRNVEPASPKRSNKRKIPEQSKDNNENIKRKKNEPFSSASATTSRDEVEDFIRSHSSHICTDEIDQKINNVQLAKTPDGSFVRRDFVIRIKQSCMNQPATVAVPERSTAVVSSTTKRENINKNTKKTRRSVTLEKTIGINLRTRTKGMEKSCTKIVHSKYTETVEKCNKKIKFSTPSHIVTRHRAASNSDLEFFHLPYYKKSLFLSDKMESFHSESKKSIDESLNENEDCDSQNKSNPVSKEKFQQTQNKNKSHVTEPVPSCSYTFPSNDESLVKHDFSIILPQKQNQSNVLQEITLNGRGSVRQAIKKSQKSHSVEQKKPAFRKENNKLSDSSADLTMKKPAVKKLRSFSKANQSLSNVATTESARKEYRNRSATREKELPNLKENKSIPKSNSQKTGKMKRGFRTRSTPKRYSSDDEPVSPKPAIRQTRSKSKTEKPIPIIDLSSDDDEEYSNYKEKKRMKKTVARSKAEKFNERRKTLENSVRKTRSRTVSEAESASKRNTRHSSKAQNESFAGNSSRYPLNVTFAETTPEVIPRRKDRTKRNCSIAFTPCSVVLDKLDVTDISIYAITPLREECERPPPKTAEDYGIDDVNTDDSTDDEDDPKKRVPDWVNSLRHRTAVQFRIPRKMIKDWIRPPKTAFTAKTLFS